MIARKFNWYLLVLAITELVYCFLVFFDYLFRLVHPANITFHEFNMFTNMLFDYAIHSADSYLVVITLVLSIDRLYAIRNPIKIKNFVTNLHSKYLTFGIFIGLLIFRIPSVFLCHYNDNKPANITYCTIVSPFVFNVLPTFFILIINSLLIKEIISYYSFKTFGKKKDRRESHIELSTSSNNKNVKVVVTVHQFKPIKGTQKSHYFVIVVLSLWSVITTIPYYTFSAYDLLFRLDIFSFYFDPKEVGREITRERMKTLRKIQIITSLFFNSSHCINFFVYFRFYFMFRHCVLRAFRNCFSKLFRIKLNSLATDPTVSGFRQRYNSIIERPGS
jgi:hypothetical protein